MSPLSNFLYRVSNIWSAFAVTLLYGFFMATVMPAQSADSLSYAGNWGAPDRHFFYTPDELYAAISGWGEAGIQDYVSFRLGLDIVWAFAYTGFLVGWISILLRASFVQDDWRRRMNVWPVLAMLADYSENFLGIILVTGYETRMDSLAWLASGMTLVKWVSLIIAHLILVYAFMVYLQRRIKS